MTKENKLLFYAYFVGFLFLAYIGRAILSPTEHHFVLWMQIVSLCILPFIYKNLFLNHRAISIVLFYLFLVLMWEVTNFVPIIGFIISSLIFQHFQINLGFDWNFVLLKPLFVLAFLYFNSKSILLFFNTFQSDKKYLITNKGQEFLDYIQEDIETNSKFYSPTNVGVYFNEFTQILSIVFDKEPKSKLKTYLYVPKNFSSYCLLDRKCDKNLQFKLENDVLYISSKNQTIGLDYQEFSMSLKDIVKEIIEHRENLNKND